MESFHLTLASSEGEPVHRIIGSCVSIAYRGSDSVDLEKAVRQAWKHTRSDFPNIAASIEPSTQEIVIGYDNSAAVEAWLLVLPSP